MHPAHSHKCVLWLTQIWVVVPLRGVVGAVGVLRGSWDSLSIED